MTTSGDPEQRLAEALRARASGAGWPGPSPAPYEPPQPSGVSARTALLLALLFGAVLGTGIALLSLLVPGFLPAIG
jgi:hypothetical protein